MFIIKRTTTCCGIPATDITQPTAIKNQHQLLSPPGPGERERVIIDISLSVLTHISLNHGVLSDGYVWVKWNLEREREEKIHGCIVHWTELEKAKKKNKRVLCPFTVSCVLSRKMVPKLCIVPQYSPSLYTLACWHVSRNNVLASLGFIFFKVCDFSFFNYGLVGDYKLLSVSFMYQIKSTLPSPIKR